MAHQTDWSEIEGLVQRAEATGGSVGVTIVGPDGDKYTHNGDRQYRAASTVKIPIMIELYRQLDRGERSLEDPYVLVDQDRAAGSGVMLHLGAGMVLTLNDLIYLMISISDNTATNILIGFAGMANVNQTMQSLGMTNSTLGREMKGRPAQTGESENWATANDYARVIQSLLDGEAASPASRALMVQMLELQQNTNRISRYLPEDPGIRWGSKTGSIAGVTNDVGFIITGKGTLIVSVFCEDLPDQHVGEQFIGDVTRAALKATGVTEPRWTS